MWRALRVLKNTGNLPVERAIFHILEKEGIKQKLGDYLEWLKAEYPSAKEAIEEIWNSEEAQEEWKSYSDETSRERWLVFVRRIVNDEDVTDNIKKEASAKLGKMFSADTTDDLVIKDLKSSFTQSNDDLSLYYDAYSRGSAIVFMTELYENFYLKWLPQHVRSKLKEKNPELAVSDLDSKGWENLKQNFLNSLYSTWTKTEEEKDLEDLINEIIKNTGELDDLIKEARKQKKGGEIEKPPVNADSSVDDISKIRAHLIKVRDEWKGYLTSQDTTNIHVLMFQKFKDKAQEILPLIEKALATDTLEGYQQLEKEWGENKGKYNPQRDYYFAWLTLRRDLGIESEGADKKLTSEQQKKLDNYERLEKLVKEHLGEEFLLQNQIEINK
ncbi:MAG: hypothetical protein I3273_00790 [Candidatus Moeniiplasma glomeromycotorum]|nr:hypothetical protein [Candidatus Moeniiplasma glomeromycotorum]MCE8167340.1 hypothetical protein [Candidatus Moeniiplasma glomeromycotorum]MCE8168647.1 hypothetical protein [Candidatus Moeniiplasma glomeromycotorum]